MVGGETVRSTGEFGLIEQVRRRLPSGPGVLVGVGDDAAVVAAPDGRVVATTDMLVDGRHFRRDWTSPVDVGRRAAAANLADVAAMGAVPTALLVALGAPGDLPVQWALSLTDGLVAEATSAGASVVGGDTVRSDVLVVSVTALGDLQGRDPVTRDGARPGDRVVVIGRLGWAAAGLALLGKGFRSPRAVADAYRRPEVPYAAGPALAQAGATAMCDVSDGLLADLGHIATASGVHIDVESARVPLARAVLDVAEALRTDPLRWALTGGDDHALVATIGADVPVPPGVVTIGTVTAIDEAGPGVTVDGRDWAGPKGWEHFAGR